MNRSPNLKLLTVVANLIGFTGCLHAGDEATTFAETVDATCKKSNRSAVEAFESKNHFSLKSAAKGVYDDEKYSNFPVSGGQLCNSLFGEKWGQIYLSSNTSDAKAEVSGAEYPINSTQPFRVKIYKVKIVSGKKSCFGDAEVTENQVKEFHCDF